MTWRSEPILRYPGVLATVAVAAAGALPWFFGYDLLSHWVYACYAGAAAAVRAWHLVRQLNRGVIGIDALAIVAIIATIAVGEVLASMIIVLMIASGQALEDFANGRAERELSALLKREPQIAHRQTGEFDQFEDVPASAVEINDVFLVRSGEVVPIDGALLSASASFDQSSLTGESLPVACLSGDAVLSGSINGNKAVLIRATALAENSQFQSILALVKAASSNRAPVVRLADRYAIPFTVVSLLIAGSAWFVSGDPARFAEVLVLATPCPLLLAAPVAFMGGMSRAARHGIIVKGGGVLETLARTRTAVFDKTGTLTHGRPTIARIQCRPPFSETELLQLVASAERYSAHVLASSIVTAAQERGIALLDVRDATEVAAEGVTAWVGTRKVSVGTFAFVQRSAPDAQVSVIYANELAIYVAIDGAFAGSIIAWDPVRADAHDTIADLRRRGVREVVMLTGDAEATARQVARVTDIAAYQADCLPGDKVRAVQALRHRPVLMVGDGVNDAPVLASAEVGIAMGAKGATAASESAGAVLLLDELSLVGSAVAIGQDTVRIALQSIWLGIGLSIGLMWVAAFGVIPAVAGAGLQEVVDLAAIFNALRAIHPQETVGSHTTVRTLDPATPSPRTGS